MHFHLIRRNQTEEHRPEAQGFETRRQRLVTTTAFFQRNTAPRRRGLKRAASAPYNVVHPSEEHRPEAQGFETTTAFFVQLLLGAQRNTAPRRRGLKLVIRRFQGANDKIQRNTAPRRRGLKRQLSSRKEVARTARGTPPRGAGV